MTTLTDRDGTALLVVDVQKDVVDGAWDRDGVVRRIADLVDRARRARTTSAPGKTAAVANAADVDLD
jgi:hypothetical protein